MYAAVTPYVHSCLHDLEPELLHHLDLEPDCTRKASCAESKGSDFHVSVMISM